jgi:hypothetical protein
MYSEYFHDNQANTSKSLVPKPTPDKVTFTVLFLAIANSLKTSKELTAQSSSQFNSAIKLSQLSISGSPTLELILSDEGRFYEKGNTNVNDISSSTTRSINTLTSANIQFNSTLPLPLVDRIKTVNVNQMDRQTIQVSDIFPLSPLAMNKKQENDAVREALKNPDAVLRYLYREMRYDLTVVPDNLMVTVLKALFQANINQRRTSNECVYFFLLVHLFINQTLITSLIL